MLFQYRYLTITDERGRNRRHASVCRQTQHRGRNVEIFALDELIVGCYEIALMFQLSCFLILHVMIKSKAINTKFTLPTAYVSTQYSRDIV